jgi:hypothetical protein
VETMTQDEQGTKPCGGRPPIVSNPSGKPVWIVSSQMVESASGCCCKSARISRALRPGNVCQQCNRKAYPSVDTIAADLGVDVRKVKAAIAELKLIPSILTVQRRNRRAAVPGERSNGGAGASGYSSGGLGRPGTLGDGGAGGSGFDEGGGGGGGYYGGGGGGGGANTCYGSSASVPSCERRRLPFHTTTIAAIIAPASPLRTPTPAGIPYCIRGSVVGGLPCAGRGLSGFRFALFARRTGARSTFGRDRFLKLQASRPRCLVAYRLEVIAC